MKNMKKVLVTVCALCTAIVNGYTQNLVASNENPTASSNQEKTVIIKNNSEKRIAVFAGPKEGIREPRVITYGGLSSNKVYVMPNDVVCLMTDDKKPIACAIIKPETTVVEVNTSATGVTGK
jgi:hypothetical protein